MDELGLALEDLRGEHLTRLVSAFEALRSETLVESLSMSNSEDLLRMQGAGRIVTTVLRLMERELEKRNE